MSRSCPPAPKTLAKDSPAAKSPCATQATPTAASLAHGREGSCEPIERRTHSNRPKLSESLSPRAHARQFLQSVPRKGTNGLSRSHNSREPACPSALLPSFKRAAPNVQPRSSEPADICPAGTERVSFGVPRPARRSGRSGRSGQGLLERGMARGTAALAALDAALSA
jgi:hypothetical protein